MPPLNIHLRALKSASLLQQAGFATSKLSGPRGSLRRPPSSKPNQKQLRSSRLPLQGPRQQQRHNPKASETSLAAQESQQSSVDAVSNALRVQDSQANSLLSPVHIPKDHHGVLNESHPATRILSNSSIVVTRQLELMNVMVGFEQANKYVIMDPRGGHIGYMAEKDLGMGKMMARQMFSTHRSFTTHVFDRQGKEVLRVC